MDIRRLLMLRLVLLLLVPALVGACSRGSGPESQAQSGVDGELAVEYPDWIERVYPPPGSELSVTQAVQINHNVVEDARQVRLIIDGVDVTSYAIGTTPGLLEYEFDEAEFTPVELDPGEHTAVVELVDVVAPGADTGLEGSEQPEILDTFTWTFTAL